MSVSVPGGFSFNFSSPGHNPALRYSQRWPSTSIKNKTPSQQRRDQRRWEAFQSKKSESSGQSPPEERQHPPISVPVSSAQKSEEVSVKPDSAPASLGVESPKSSESTTSSNPSVNEMEVESPPSAQTPTSSPKRPKLDEKSPIRPSAQENSNKIDPNDPILLSEWPEALTTSLNDQINKNKDFTILTVIEAKNDVSALSSLNQTLKKCNLRSFRPTQTHKSRIEGNFSFKFNVLGKYVRRTLLNLRKNWISVENSQLSGFFLTQYFILND